MGMPVVIVDSGGIAVTESANGIGTPVSVSDNGYGMAVTLVDSGGLPVVGANTEPSDPVTLFAANPPLDSDDTNTGLTFFVVVTLNSEEPQDQLRVTIAPGSTNTLTTLGVGVAKFTSEAAQIGTITEVLFSEASGFASKTTEQTSDWIDISDLGLEAGDQLVVSYTTGGAGQATTRYEDAAYVADTYFEAGTSWNDGTTTLDSLTKLAGRNYAISSVETRSLTGGGGTIPAENLIPMSFDDPMFSAMTEYPSYIQLAIGTDLSRMSIVNQVGESSITLLGDNEVSYCRVNSREAVRLISTGTVNKCYLESTGLEAELDHADTIQVFSEGQTGGDLTITNTHSVAHLAAANANFFCSDNWSGALTLQDVIFQGGPYGMRIDADPGCHIDISLQNVYFVGPFGTAPYLIQEIDTGTYTILQWGNVREATIVNGVLVPGDFIDPPVPYDPVTALGSKLVAYWDANRADTLTVVSSTDDDNAVTAWADIVAGYSATPADVASRPAYLPTGLSGAPCLSFDTTQYLTCTDAGLLAALPDGAEPSEMWVVLSQDALPADTTERYAVAYGGSSITTGRGISRIVTTGVNRTRSRTGTGAAATNISDTAVDFSGVHVIRQIVGATSSSLEIDGGTASSAAAVPSTTNSRLRIGSISASGVSNSWNGKIAAVLVTTTLTSDEAAALHKYLG